MLDNKLYEIATCPPGLPITQLPPLDFLQQISLFYKIAAAHAQSNQFGIQPESIFIHINQKTNEIDVNL